MRFVSLILGVVMAGCGGTGTSLDGPYDCSGMTCSSGQVCITIPAGIDAGNDVPAGSHDCEAPPEDCDIVDCVGNLCPTCIQRLCDPTPIDRVSNRDVYCIGQ